MQVKENYQFEKTKYLFNGIFKDKRKMQIIVNKMYFR